MDRRKCEIGIVGLGVMGRNLTLNIADKGFTVAGYDADRQKVEILVDQADMLSVRAARSMADFVDALRSPRAVMMLVPAGSAVDSVIESLLPFLKPGDVLMDGGNSHFRETEARGRKAAEQGLVYMGVGISGGESGARFGPSIMPGGTEAGYDRVRNVLESVAARVDGNPCVSYLGPGSAGTYVKMVHNGIEYALMQLIAECYHLMKQGLDLGAGDLQQIFDGWNASDLKGYLVEITARIFEKKDDETGGFLVDRILDGAQEKGTGKWMVQDAMDLRIPVPTIAAAVAARDASALRDERRQAAGIFRGPEVHLAEEAEGIVTSLHKAMTSAMLIAYAQGMAQLARASMAYGYGLNLGEVARVWTGGCIIRSDLLGPIRDAYRNGPSLPNLLLDPVLAQYVMNGQVDLRRVVSLGAVHAVPLPAFAASLSYLDTYRSPWLPANLIQAQRDFFGSHRYQRIDKEGMFHTEWE
jgi:6-phosphogluconate dehydrogenase